MKIYDAIVMVPTKVRIKTTAPAGVPTTNAAHDAIESMGGIGKVKCLLHSMEFVSEGVTDPHDPQGLHSA